VSLPFAISPALPLGQAGKYVAAAYIVVFVVILIYVAIMAMRAQRTQQEIDELRRDLEAVKAREAEHDHDHDSDDGAGPPASERAEQIA
jgi:CcmD family protein